MTEGEKAIQWFEARNKASIMPGARKMAEMAIAALRAQQEAEQQGPCSRCGYGGEYLDAPPCTICPAPPKGAENNTPPSTAADRIRLMSDEELAAFLCNIQAEKACEPCKTCVASDHCRAGHNGFIDWLQQPAQEEQQ